jgi:MFS transporter, DHA1 family, multidrug resistance protein
MKDYFVALFHLPPGVKRFIATESLLGIGIGIYSLVLNLHLLDLGVQESAIGAINAFAALFTGAASIPAGFALKYIGRKRALVIGIALMAAGYALYGFADRLFLFYAAQCVVSCGLTLLVTSEIQLLFHYCREKKDEPRAYGGLFASFTLFTGVGTLLAGWLPSVLHWGSRYEGTLMAAAGALLLAAALRALLLPTEATIHDLAALKAETENNDEAHVPPAGGKRELRRLTVLTIFLFLSGLSFGFLIPFLNLIVKLRFELPDGPLSVIFAVYGFATFAGSLLMPYVLERWGMSRAFGALYTLELLLLVLLSAPLSTAVFLLPFILRGGTQTILNHMADSQTMSAVPDEMRNIFAGVRSVARNLGVSFASFLGGYVLAAKHYGWPFLLTAAVLLLHALYYYAFARREIRSVRSQS